MKLFLLRQASFKLSWGCNGEKNGQHKHDIVSFERGNITTAARSSKQVILPMGSFPYSNMPRYFLLLACEVYMLH